MSTIPTIPTQINPELIGEPQVRGASGTTRIADGGDAPQDAPPAPIAGTPLIMDLHGQIETVMPAALQMEQYTQQLREQIRAAGGAPIFDLRHLLAWSDGERWAVLSFIAGLEAGYTVRHGEFGEPGDLFVAVLNAMVGDEDVARCGLGVRAAVETAAILHHQPAALPAACGRIAQRLADLNVLGYTPHQLRQQAEQLAGGVRGHDSGGEQALVTIHTTLADAPVPAEAVVPEGWMLSAEGINQGTADKAIVVTSAPMVITRRFTEVDGDAEHLGVAWPRDGAGTRKSCRGQRLP